MGAVHVLRATNELLEARGITAYIGAENLGRNDKAPRVVWVFGEGDGEPGRAQQGRSVRAAIATRVARFDVHLWARRADLSDPVDEDYVVLEQLANSVLLDLRQCIGPGTYVYEGERYPDADGGGQAVQSGRRSIMTVSLLLPVVETEALTQVTTWTPTTVEQFNPKSIMKFPTSEVES